MSYFKVLQLKINMKQLLLESSKYFQKLFINTHTCITYAIYYNKLRNNGFGDESFVYSLHNYRMNYKYYFIIEVDLLRR